MTPLALAPRLLQFSWPHPFLQVVHLARKVKRKAFHLEWPLKIDLESTSGRIVTKNKGRFQWSSHKHPCLARNTTL